MVLAKNKKRHLDQWNRLGSPEINPCIYGQLVYDRRATNIQWKIVSLIKGVRKTRQTHARGQNYIDTLHYTQTQDGLKT